MPHSVHRLPVTVLMLLTGCASPMLSGQMSLGRRGSVTPASDIASDPALPGATRDSQLANRKPSENRNSTRETPALERRTQELLAAGSRSRRDGKLAAARMSYEQVLRIDRENSEAHYWLAVIADDQGRFADAELHYSVLLKQNPRDPNVLASLGWSQLLQGRYDDSERTLRNALTYSPTHQTALYNLGWLYGTRGDYQKALGIFRSAGNESDAQRAIAELRQNAPRSEGAIGADVYAAQGGNRPLPADRLAADAGLPSERSEGGYSADAAPQLAGAVQRQETASGYQPAAARERSISRNISAPAPWNGGRAGGGEPAQPLYADLAAAGPQSFNSQSGVNPPAMPPSGTAAVASGRIPAGQNPGMFSEIDRYAGSSPTQANHARQAEMQSRGLDADSAAPGFAPVQPTSTEPTSFEQSHRMLNGAQPPVITPRTVGAGTNGTGSGTTATNSLTEVNPLATGARTTNSPILNAAAAREAGLPGSSGAAATGLPGAASQIGFETQRSRNSWNDAQTTAAQLGLNAGVAGPVFSISDARESTPGAGTADTRQAPAGLLVSGAWPQLPPGPSAPIRQANASRLPPAPSNAFSGDASLRQTSDLPAWSGRNSLAAPIPTEVVPAAEAPGYGTGAAVPPVSYSSAGSLPARTR